MKACVVECGIEPQSEEIFEILTCPSKQRDKLNSFKLFLLLGFLDKSKLGLGPFDKKAASTAPLVVQRIILASVRCHKPTVTCFGAP